MSDRGQTDVVGFVLVFSLIAATIGVVTVSGIGGLEDVRDYERTNNAARAFDILADNIGDIHREGAPSRSTEIKLADASLRLGESSKLTVENTGLSPPLRDSVTIRPLIYEARDGAHIVYENGAVIRESPDSGAVMIREPNFVFSTHDGIRTAMIPAVQTRAGESTESVASSGASTVLIRSELAISEVLSSRTSPITVTLRFATAPERAPVWHRYFESRLADGTWSSSCTVTGSVVECQFQVDRLYVTATRIDVKFD
ncbi:DUF7289 family protein [Halogranum rubrum]|uniref:Uncharacterized protein n=1 Tax=Halogranum salarium B-1 TaxID=1210908 RepID=J2ZHU3_9EURY|nr:hypothetical protein [Halogranum salarium]EJN60265.1 hypothetical protein HSB1_08680 [Halogranum salarium B-1]